MTNQQDEQILNHDGRYYVLARQPDNALLVLIKTEKLGKQGHISFGIPSSPALFLNVARRSYFQIKDIDPEQMFYKWQNGRIPINHSNLFDYFEQFSSHIVFSFTALEAFANEMIPKEFEYKTERKGVITILKKHEIERIVSLDEKLHSVLPEAIGVSTPKGKKSWQHYKLLKSMRDRVIHLKSVDRSASGSERESVWGMMLRAHGVPFCDYAHAMMMHYLPSANRRWHREYPYSRVESDKVFGE